MVKDFLVLMLFLFNVLFIVGFLFKGVYQLVFNQVKTKNGLMSIGISIVLLIPFYFLAESALGQIKTALTILKPKDDGIVEFHDPIEMNPTENQNNEKLTSKNDSSNTEKKAIDDLLDTSNKNQSDSKQEPFQKDSKELSKEKIELNKDDHNKQKKEEKPVNKENQKKKDNQKNEENKEKQEDKEIEIIDIKGL